MLTRLVGSTIGQHTYIETFQLGAKSKCSTGRSRHWHPLVALRPLTGVIGPDLGYRPGVGLVSRPYSQFTPIATPPTSLKSHPSSRASLKLHWLLFTTPLRATSSLATANHDDGMSNTDVFTGLFHVVPTSSCVSTRHYQCHLGHQPARPNQP